MSAETEITNRPAEAELEAAPPATIQRAVKQPLPKVLALEDLEAPARRRLPRGIFGFISGGSESASTVRANRAAFSDWAFRTRVLVDIRRIRMETTIFGKRYAAPFGIAPMGGCCLGTLDGDLKLARAACAAELPFILSGASTVPLERIRKEAPTSWFQAYCPIGRDKISMLIDRVAAAGYEVLVITVDVPVPSNRENNIRNGFAFPARLTTRTIRDGLTHPHWLFRTGLPSFKADGPHYENFSAERGAPLFRFGKGANPRSASLDWSDMEFIRQRWGGKLVIKGVLSAEDARLSRNIGADGIVVSNHAGRQLDHATATLRVLPEIAAAASGLTVMLDGGVRRGTDVLKALALGASCVFIGRPFLYAATLGGEAGVEQAIGLMKDEINRDLALVGCPNAADLHPGFLVPTERPRLS